MHAYLSPPELMILGKNWDSNERPSSLIFDEITLVLLQNESWGQTMHLT